MPNAMRFSHLDSADCTDTGRKRKHNEDSLICMPGEGLFCVADGMGGTFGGEVASQAAVEGLQHEFENLESDGRARSFEERVDAVRRALNDASSWIRNHADEMGVTGTGTTAVVILFDPHRPTRATALHAGDSRLYRFRDGKLQQVTMDHSVAAAAGMKSDKALPAMFRGVVTRAVGLEKQVLLEETPVDVAAGDLFMLCSDGLNKMVPDKTVARMIKDEGGGDLQVISKLLVDAANAAGGEDNTSVVMIRVASDLPASEAAPTGATDTHIAAPDAAPSAENLTQATRPAPPRPALERGKPSERKSDPQHLSGGTPTGARDSVTPVTSDFQQTPTGQGSTANRDEERSSALKHIAESQNQRRLLILFIVVGLLVVVVTGNLLLFGRHKAKPEPAAEPAAEIAPVPVVPSEPAEVEAPVAEPPAAEPVAAEPVAAEPAATAPAPAEPAPAETVPAEPVPAPAVPAAAAPAQPAAEELERVRNSLRVDMLETVMTGNWGDLEPKVESARELVPGAVEGMPESAMYDAWLAEWKKAEFAAPPPADLFGGLRDATLAALGIGQLDARLPMAPAWSGTPRKQAGAYCSLYNTLQSAFLDAMDDHALNAQQEAVKLADEAVAILEWLQVRAADPDDAPRVTVGQLRAAADAEAAWALEKSAAHAPIGVTAINGEAAAKIEAVEAARDAFYSAVVDTVRSVNSQKAGWDSATDPAFKEQVYQIGVQRVRVVNIRARYKDDVRGWRRHEGAGDVRKFLQLVKQAFPDSAPAP